MMGRPATACAILLATISTVHAASRTVALRAADGTELAATIYEPAQRPAPGVVLLHMLARSRRDWDWIADRLSQAGFLVLALDLRGHGQSAVPVSRAGGLDDLAQDAKAAVAYLRSRPGVLPNQIGIVGASLGASLAAIAAGPDPAIRSLVLVSPSLDYRGLRCASAMRQYGDRPALLIASARDPYALRSARELADRQPARELLISEPTGHGTVLLSRDPGLVDRVVDWFRRTLL